MKTITFQNPHRPGGRCRIKKLLPVVFLLLASQMSFAQDVEKTFKSILPQILMANTPGNTDRVYKKDIFGNTVIEDGGGNKIATFKKI